MKLRAAAFAAVLAVVTTPAFAQYGWRGDYYGPGRYYDHAPYDDLRPYYGPRGYEGPRPYARVPDELGLSRREIVAILHAANLEPASSPWRAGAHVMVRARNARGEVVRVAIDAYRGRIVAVGPASGTGASAGLTPDERGASPQAGDDPMATPPRVITAPRGPESHNAAVPPRTPMPRPRPPETTASIKAAPETPAAPAAAAPAPAPQPETAPSAVPPKPEPPTDLGFPPVAPLD